MKKAFVVVALLLVGCDTPFFRTNINEQALERELANRGKPTTVQTEVVNSPNVKGIQYWWYEETGELLTFIKDEYGNWKLFSVLEAATDSIPVEKRY